MTAQDDIAELKGQLAALQRQMDERDETVAAVTAALAERDERLGQLVADSEGWLVSTPNPVYDGNLYGIHFVNGQAFVRANQVVEAFVFKPMKQTVLDTYPATEQAAMAWRATKSSAQLAVDEMEASYGYTVQWFGRDRQDDLQRVIDQRVQQRRQVEVQMTHAAQAEAQAAVRTKYLGA